MGPPTALIGYGEEAEEDIVVKGANQEQWKRINNHESMGN